LYNFIYIIVQLFLKLPSTLANLIDKKIDLISSLC